MRIHIRNFRSALIVQAYIWGTQNTQNDRSLRAYISWHQTCWCTCHSCQCFTVSSILHPASCRLICWPRITSLLECTIYIRMCMFRYFVRVFVSTYNVCVPSNVTPEWQATLKLCNDSCNDRQSHCCIPLTPLKSPQLNEMITKHYFWH